MKTEFTAIALLLFFIHPTSSLGQGFILTDHEKASAYFSSANDAAHPCISTQEYEKIWQRCSENASRLGLDTTSQQRAPVLFSWPLQSSEEFTDCSYYGITGHVDQDIQSGSVADYHCGMLTYDGHQGTDIATWPFPFYKMENDQVQVIAAADGILIDKGDGQYDRNCEWNGMSANYAIVQHEDGSRALYWHMKSGSVTSKVIGEHISTGEYLGIVGSSGISTGPHLHFELQSADSNPTYLDPYSGDCNILNANSWWADQKPYLEPALLKTSVHTTDVNMPPCPQTEELNESNSFTIPFQGPGLPPGYAKFYIFLRDVITGTKVDLRMKDADGNVINSWNYTFPSDNVFYYWGWSKKLPATEGTYTFEATYNEVTCAQTFDIQTLNGIATLLHPDQFNLYPNPSSSTIHLEGESIENGVYNLAIESMTGRRVWHDQVFVENGFISKPISISTIPTGTYFLYITNEKGITVKKICKQD